MVRSVCPRAWPIRSKRIRLILRQGSFNGNASNMARIWSMVREGLVRSPDGKRWQQVIWSATLWKTNVDVDRNVFLWKELEQSRTSLNGHTLVSRVMVTKAKSNPCTKSAMSLPTSLLLLLYCSSDIWQLCCTDMCPSDEIFLFGFSRGACTACSFKPKAECDSF